MHFTGYRGQVERVTVERAGDVRALVRAEGRYANDATGRKWLPFTVRFYFYAGSEQVKMVHTFVFDGDMDHDFIRSLGIRFEVPMREAVYNRHISFRHGRWWGMGGTGAAFGGPSRVVVGWEKDCRRGRCVADALPAYEKFDAKIRHLLDRLGGVGRFPVEPDDGRRFFYP